MLGSEELVLRIRRSGIRPLDIVRYSQGKITSNQASQWLLFWKRNRRISKSVYVMLWMMSERKEIENATSQNSEQADNVPKIFRENGFENSRENAFQFEGKMSLQIGSYIRKGNKVYVNFEGVVYEGVGDVLEFSKDGRRILLEIGFEIMGKWVQKN